MKKGFMTAGQYLAKKSIIFQLVATFIISLFFLMHGTYSAISSLMGGGIHVISYIVFSFFAFLTINARAPKKIVAQFAVGELLKMTITVLLFVLIFKFIDKIQVIPLVLAYIAMIFVALFVSAVYNNEH